MKLNRTISHTLLMLAGCAAMLVALLAFTSTTTGNSWGVYLLLLLCPAMHFLMHRGMHRRGNQHKTSKALLPAPETKVSGNERTKLSR